MSEQPLAEPVARARPAMRFQTGAVVLHLKTGRRYQILMGPDVCRIEADRSPAYAYRLEDALADGDATVWVRPAAEMEDGRFAVCAP